MSLLTRVCVCLCACVCVCVHVCARIVDGKDYFGQVAEAMLAAKDEIFITDWM